MLPMPSATLAMLGRRDMARLTPTLRCCVFLFSPRVATMRRGPQQNSSRPKMAPAGATRQIAQQSTRPASGRGRRAPSPPQLHPPTCKSLTIAAGSMADTFALGMTCGLACVAQPSTPRPHNNRTHSATGASPRIARRKRNSEFPGRRLHRKPDECQHSNATRSQASNTAQANSTASPRTSEGRNTIKPDKPCPAKM